jgi:hypothetical protein
MKTPYLADDGEENWEYKYHLGCGGVYLDGYKNCDIDGVSSLEHPGLVAQNRTTIADYYARLNGDIHNLPTRRQTVFDIRSDATCFAYMPGMIDKIVAIQVFEHFTPMQAIKTLQRWYVNLRNGGVLVLSVPDMTGTLELIERGDAEFALRHLRGRQGDRYNSHWAWYTGETIMELIGEHGFNKVHRLSNFHFYPAIVVKAIK